MSGVETIEIAAADAGIRLDRWLKRRFPDVPHGHFQKWLRTGQVRIDGKRAKANARLEAGQSVRVPPVAESQRPAKAPFVPREPSVGTAEADDLIGRILYRDDDIIALDKPAGLAVQGGTGTHRHLDGMLDLFRFGAPERPRLVHRLDRDTSGVLLLARSARVAAFLTESFRGRTVRKLYWALVVGLPVPFSGRIGLKLSKRPGRGGEKVEPDEEGGKRAETLYRVIDRAARKAAWLAMEPLTGRTHQLRAHAAALGTPIVGDGKYGGQAAFLEGEGIGEGLHLLARTIRFRHPSGKIVDVTAELPEHMRRTWLWLGLDPAEGRRGADPFDIFEE